MEEVGNRRKSESNHQNAFEKLLEELGAHCVFFSVFQTNWKSKVKGGEMRQGSTPEQRGQNERLFFDRFVGRDKTRILLFWKSQQKTKLVTYIQRIE